MSLDTLYILDGRTPVNVKDMLEWGRWFETNERHVAYHTIESPNGKAKVSTIFLGLDHRFGVGPPLLFETMVFGDVLDRQMQRCSTWAEAEAMHATMCWRVHAELEPKRLMPPENADALPI